MMYFTSDTHFDHANIIKYSKRPFGDVAEMNRELIKNWNAVVSPEDTVYHLGDFSFRLEDDWLAILNGKKIFIKGSHDKWMREADYPYLREIKLPQEYWTSEHPLTLTLCHYAMRSWNLSHYGSWHLFGHHHGSLPSYGLSFDVGVDCTDYTPLSLPEVAERMSKLTPIVDYSKKHG